MAEEAKKVCTEYMGFDSLVIAEVTEDAQESYTTGTPESFAPAGEIKKSVERDQVSKSYDNQTYIVIKSEGDDTVELVIPVLPLSMEAKVTGANYNATTGILSNDGNPKTKYFAIGYRLMMSDNTYRYVWRLKGTLTQGDEEAKSKEGTDSNNVTYTFTGVKTIHKFTATGDGCKDQVADERDGMIDYAKWFEQVVTPDNQASLAKA